MFEPPPRIKSGTSYSQAICAASARSCTERAARKASAGPPMRADEWRDRGSSNSTRSPKARRRAAQASDEIGKLRPPQAEIGRASCREREEITVEDGA